MGMDLFACNDMEGRDHSEQSAHCASDTPQSKQAQPVENTNSLEQIVTFWTTNLTACTEDVHVCCAVLFCCGCQATKLRASLQDREPDCGDLFCGCLLTMPCFWLCGLKFIDTTRAMFLRRHNIFDHDCSFTSGIMPLCSLCQMIREAHIRIHNPTIVVRQKMDDTDMVMYGAQ
jgi:Cys-rich protein (TIGR01571 family)